MYNIKITDIGMYVPELIISNDDLSKIVDTNDEWIYTRTGIKNRHMTTDENTSDLAVNAVKNMNYEGVDLIIVSTFTPDMKAPTTSSIIQKKLGIANVSCMDINAGCTGFIYAMNTAIALINSNMYKKVLLISSEILTKVVDWEDRSTCVLFGDAAGALVLEKSDKTQVLATYTNGIPDEENSLYVGTNLLNNPYHKEGESVEPLRMDGLKVFKFAKGAVADAINKVLDDAKLTLDDIKLIIPHQANERIISAVSKSLDVSMDKFYLNIHKYGNTSSASIPVAFYEAVQEGKIERGDKVIFVGFGAGLTWGAIVIEY